jgi:hypothetical protein
VSVEIRSYRAVFDLERRIYRVDRLRLNPGGIPLRGVVYCFALLAGLALLGALPLVGEAVRALPWYLRDLVLPAGGAALLTVIRVEGRPFHLAAAALLRHALGLRSLAGSCALGGPPALSGPRSLAGPCAGARLQRIWLPESLLVLPDGSDARLRRLRFTGPGAVLVRVAHARSARRPDLLGRVGGVLSLRGRPHVTVRELPGGQRSPDGQVIALERGARLEVDLQPIDHQKTTPPPRFHPKSPLFARFSTIRSGIATAFEPVTTPRVKAPQSGHFTPPKTPWKSNQRSGRQDLNLRPPGPQPARSSVAE